MFEIGMNHPGEIAPLLAKIAAPDAAIITNIGVAHIEFMGTREAIALEKGDARGRPSARKDCVVLNAEDAFTELIAARTQARVITAGTATGSVRAAKSARTPNGTRVHHPGTEHTAVDGQASRVPGLHMVQNALLAVAAGRVFGLSLEECAAGLAQLP